MGDDPDVIFIVHPAEAELGADGDAGGNVGQQQRLLRQVGQIGQNRGGQNADADGRYQADAPAFTAGPDNFGRQQYGRR